MNDETIRAEVRRVLGLVLGRTYADGAEIRRDQEPAWDSLKHVEIFFAVEDRFGVHFTAEELGSLSSSAKIAQAVERHLAA